MIDVIFSPALPCGIEGTSCQGLAQGGLIIEDRRRLDGPIPTLLSFAAICHNLVIK